MVASPATFDVYSCAGLADPGHILVYDTINSLYTVARASVKLSYTGPKSITSGKKVTLSARMTSKATGKGGWRFKIGPAIGSGSNTRWPGSELSYRQDQQPGRGQMHHRQGDHVSAQRGDRDVDPGEGLFGGDGNGDGERGLAVSS